MTAFLLSWAIVSVGCAVVWSLTAEASTIRDHRRGPRDRRHAVRRLPLVWREHHHTPAGWKLVVHVDAPTPAAAWHALERVA